MKTKLIIENDIQYTVETSNNGDKFWYRNNQLHREDGPAVEYTDGGKFWYRNNQLHREGGPAVECVDGEKRWYSNGKRHRENGPAVENANGDKEWWLNDKQLHITSNEQLLRLMNLKAFL